MNNKWLSVKHCPLCECIKYENHGTISVDYRFGDETIELPKEGVSIYKCTQCNLFYKDTVPSPHFLSEVFTRNAGIVWQDDYDFYNEKLFILKLANYKSIDLLDIGPSSGNLLQALNEVGGRRSGLDIIAHPGITESINGEFINALIEDKNINWSEKPYDIITLFDVFEHFYDPNTAFINLREMIKKDGYIVLETGNAESKWPLKYGANNWWYSQLFEHHIFWSHQSLSYAAKKHNFEIIHFKQKPHKLIPLRPIKTKIKNFLLANIYMCSSKLYEKIGSIIGRQLTQPVKSEKDHIFTILKKIPNNV